MGSGSSVPARGRSGSIFGRNSRRNAQLEDGGVDDRSFQWEYIIGKGGFGRVKAAFKKDTRTWYAIKMMGKAKVLTKRHGVDMLYHELDMLQQLQTNGASSELVVPLHWAFQDQRMCYFVFDLVDGGDLRFHLNHRNHKMSEKAASFYIASVILALEHIHSHDILHRDIKPENCLLDAKGFVRIADFGISHVLAHGRVDTTSKSGTTAYMSPESLGTSKAHGKTSEYWQLGIMLYEMLCGERPWTKCSPEAIEFVDYCRSTGVAPEILNEELPDRLKLPAIFGENLWEGYEGSLSDSAKQMLSALLEVRPWKRVNSDSKERTRALDFVKDINWTAILKRDDSRITPPIVPDPDVSNNDCLEDNLMDTMGLYEPLEHKKLSEEEQSLFAEFKYIAPQYKKKPVEINSSMDGAELDGGTNPAHGAAMRSGNSSGTDSNAIERAAKELPYCSGLIIDPNKTVTSKKTKSSKTTSSSKCSTKDAERDRASQKVCAAKKLPFCSHIDPESLAAALQNDKKMVELHSPLIEAVVLASNGHEPNDAPGQQHGVSAGKPTDINCPAVVIPSAYTLDTEAGAAGAAAAIALASTNTNSSTDVDATLIAAHTKTMPEQRPTSEERAYAAIKRCGVLAASDTKSPPLSPQRLNFKRAEHKHDGSHEERPEVNTDAKADDDTPALPVFPQLEGVATAPARVPSSQNRGQQRRDRAVLHEAYEGDGNGNGDVDGDGDFGSSPTSVLLFGGDASSELPLPPTGAASEFELEPMDHRRAKSLAVAHDIKASSELHVIVEKRNRRNSMAF